MEQRTVLCSSRSRSGTQLGSWIYLSKAGIRSRAASTNQDCIFYGMERKSGEQTPDWFRPSAIWRRPSLLDHSHYTRRPSSCAVHQSSRTFQELNTLRRRTGTWQKKKVAITEGMSEDQRNWLSKPISEIWNGRSSERWSTVGSEHLDIISLRLSKALRMLLLGL